MGRPKGSLNKENLENKPIELETTVEDLKKEKATESKTIVDYEEDVVNGESKKLTDITGIGPATAEKLKELGYISILDLATARADEVSSLMKVNYSIAKGWTMRASEMVLAKMTMKTANEQDKDKKAIQKFILTGSSDFNDMLKGFNMLQGGMPTMSITGLVGRFASGKTQICFDAIVDCLGRLKEKAAFIETEPDTFNLDRLKEIAYLRNLECNWDDLYIAEAKQIPTAKAQFLQYKVVQKFLEKGENIRLVVVDSFNAKFRAGWSRSEMLPIRTREFAEHYNLIEILASRYNIAWLLTFQVIAPVRPDQGLKARIKFQGEYYPVGGDLVLHTVNNWIGLEQIAKTTWEAELFDNGHIKRGNCIFILTAKGLMNGVK